MASIWLRPEGRQEQRLQELINRLAEEHGTVKFAPHLTVCGIPDDLAVLDAAADYVRHCGLLPLRVARSTVTGAVITPFRAVFIAIAELLGPQRASTPAAQSGRRYKNGDAAAQRFGSQRALR